MSDFCEATADVEIDGTSGKVLCSMPADHPEAHSCRIWWHNADSERAEPSGETR